ncbi:MAG: 30S ribosomal protein S24e [Methanobacterium sp.]|jgi:small subunit ribosomal protein S24e|uniref:Small ribosomal subunit protein eS24 n=1 Tax=Methanobacterium subterraneum TaxID=59277 RepID=A0A2H4VCN8_9EURY|nr:MULTISPECIES: 30S ribosomal protein S24e [Methanobacterium]AUB55868.1 30S ribosomal protein S24e [Methanobacterium subterraneum]AUB57121.1 30S ribosomal protein S24e [Methanobacterium sp. MZ-A1]AUB60263.1 30S ribosomal protein S24e [Methanobacterium subterraneum]MCC7561082.1 30S ribosomal protein S24e [Methanobacterium sp.]
MEIDIKEQVENPLLNRTEIHFDCIYQGESTPKVMEVKNRLVAQLNVDKNLLVVDRVKPSFGEGRADGYAKLYDSEEKLAQIEKEHVLEKNKEAAKEEAEEEE